MLKRLLSVAVLALSLCVLPLPASASGRDAGPARHGELRRGRTVHFGDLAERERRGEFKHDKGHRVHRQDSVRHKRHKAQGQEDGGGDDGGDEDGGVDGGVDDCADSSDPDCGADAGDERPFPLPESVPDAVPASISMTVSTGQDSLPSPDGAWIPGQTQGSAGGWNPPDTQGAVGPSHVVSMVNSQIVITDRSGNNLRTVDMKTFWTSGGSTVYGSAFDPRVQYDRLAGRWIMVTGAGLGDLGHSQFLMAVSQSSDPTGAWSLYSFFADGFNPTQHWIDYPTLGFNGKWVVVHGDLIGQNGGGTTDAVWAFNKAQLYAGQNAGYAYWELGGVGWMAMPSEGYDASVPDAYVAFNDSLSSLALYRISGNVGSESFAKVASVGAPSNWSGGGPGAPQLGSSTLVGSLDNVIMGFVVRNGALWAVETVSPNATPARQSLQVWKMATNGALQQFSRLDDPSGQAFYSFGSLAVNAHNDALLGFTRFSADSYPSAAYSLHAAGDAAGSFRAPVIYKAGQSPGSDRWGDYSHTVVDPNNDLDLWTVQEYQAASGWGTWWATVSAPDQPTVTPTVTKTATPGIASTWRINAGGPAYTDTAGKAWSADLGYSGGAANGNGNAIANTTDAPLYQTERWGAPGFSYSLSVPSGSYRVTLKFAEIFDGSAGQRLINASLNGSSVLSAFDAFAASGGANRAVDRVFNDLHPDASGHIVISISSAGGSPDPNAKLSALSIEPMPPTPTPSRTATRTVTRSATRTPTRTVTRTTTRTATRTSSPTVTLTATRTPTPSASPTPLQLSVWRVNAGGPALTDSAGQAWSADLGYTGGASNGNGNSISNSADPALYQSERWGNPGFSYAFSVPAGRYRVTLKFAEIFDGSPGQRVMDISLNGSLVLPGYEVYADAGGMNRAIDRVFSHIQPGADGYIRLQVMGAAGSPDPNAKLSALSIEPDLPTATVTLSATRTDTRTVTGTFTQSPTASSTRTATLSATPTATRTESPTRTLSATPSTSPSWTPTGTRTATPSVTLTPTRSWTLTATPTASPTRSQTRTRTPTPVSTRTATRTATPAFVAQSTWRINAGGPALNDSQGHAWIADAQSSGGNTNGNGNSVANTADPALYQTERWGNPGFSYRLAVPPGHYQVTLKFAEIFDNGAGLRVMDLSLNEATVLGGFDAYSAAGGFNRAIDKVFTDIQPAVDGFITVGVQTVASSPDRNAKLSALEVIPQPAATPTPASACSGLAAWNPNSVSYAVGDLVSYNSRLYRCLQAHTSQAGWDPASVPALWTDLGSCASPGQLSAARLEPKVTPGAALPGGRSLIAGPNPARDWLRASWSLGRPAQVRLRFSSLDGVALQVLDLGPQPAGRGDWRLSLQGLASGIYLLDLETDAGEGWGRRAEFKVAVRK